MRRIYPAVALAASLLLPNALVPAAEAGGPAEGASACPPRAICDTALGISIVPQAGWIRLLPPRVPKHEIDLVRPTQGPSYDERLIVRSFGTTGNRNNREAAARAASQLVASLHAQGVTRVPVRYGGVPGVLLRGLPPTPQPAVDIVLARSGRLYLLILPGPRLAPDQRTALRTLRLVPGIGPFPSKNPPTPHLKAATLTVSPNPVRLGQPLTVSLTGAGRGQIVIFQAEPLHGAGFGGGQMGRHRAGVARAIRFTYPAFEKRWEIGTWRITASNGSTQIASTTVQVTGTR